MDSIIFKIGQIVKCYVEGELFKDDSFVSYGVVKSRETFAPHTVYTVKSIKSPDISKDEINDLINEIGGRTYQEHLLEKV